MSILEIVLAAAVVLLLLVVVWISINAGRQNSDLNRLRREFTLLNRMVLNSLPVMTSFAAQLFRGLHPTLKFTFVWCDPAINMQGGGYTAEERKRIRQLDAVWMPLDERGLSNLGFVQPWEFRLSPDMDESTDDPPGIAIGDKALFFMVSFDGDNYPTQLTISVHTYVGPTAGTDALWQSSDCAIKVDVYGQGQVQDVYQVIARGLYRQAVARAYGDQ